jgi:hypothetical protein
MSGRFFSRCLTCPLQQNEIKVCGKFWKQEKSGYVCVYYLSSTLKQQL